MSSKPSVVIRTHGIDRWITDQTPADMVTCVAGYATADGRCTYLTGAGVIDLPWSEVEAVTFTRLPVPTPAAGRQYRVVEELFDVARSVGIVVLAAGGFAHAGAQWPELVGTGAPILAVGVAGWAWLKIRRRYS